MTRYLILLRCYKNLQERLEYGERQKLTSEYDNIRQFYHHETQRIRDELKRIEHLAIREGLDVTNDDNKVPNNLEEWLLQRTKHIGNRYGR